MITLTQTESTLSLSANIRPKGYEGAEFVPEGLTVEVVGRNNGALLQHLNGNIEGDRLSVDIDLDDVQDVDIYDLVINYRLRDARYIRGYRAVNIIETAFEARRSENTSILGGGNTARATVITPVASEGANAGTAQTLDLAKLKPEQVEALKQALGINASQGAGQALDLAKLSPEQIEALKTALGVNTATGSGEQGTQSLDLSNLSPEQIEQTKQLLGIDDERLSRIIEDGVYSFDYTASSDACQVLVFDEAMQLFEHKLRADTQSSSPTIGGTLYDLSKLVCELRKNTYNADKRYTNDLNGITRGVLNTQIVMGEAYPDYDTRFENMLSVNIDGDSGVSSSGSLEEFIEVLAKNLNKLISRVERLEAGQ